MIRKKQVIIALSVVTVAFLLGTVTMTAMGGGWREYRALWEAIHEIQERLDASMHVSTDTLVWWEQHLTPMAGERSSDYSASGFGHLHVIAYSRWLSDWEKITVRIMGKVWNADHTVWYAAPAYSFDLTSTLDSHAITIPTPSETFYFFASTDGISEGDLFLSFYLTWA